MTRPAGFVDLYGSNYRRFDSTLYEEIRREAFGEDLGSNSWLTPTELSSIPSALKLGSDSRLLDVACGPGGPALRLARATGCQIVGVDSEGEAIDRARREAERLGLSGRAGFEVLDASSTLPFGPQEFDAILCVDAINHFRDRARVLAEWQRLLRPGGRLLFTDPIAVTGALSNEEMAIRGSIGFYLFVPDGQNERLLAEAGFLIREREDGTASVASIARGRREARQKRASELRELEGEATFEGQQKFLQACEDLARERRLSRFLYLAERPPAEPRPATASSIEIRQLASDEEARLCAQMMASSEPWVTLRRDYAASLAILRDRSRERYVAVEAGALVGFLILDLRGAFPGYIQTVCVAPGHRRRGLGSELVRFAEARVFRQSSNVFLCVSEFNHDARRLYDRLGYAVVGALPDYLAAGHTEILMRKTTGPMKPASSGNREGAP